MFVGQQLDTSLAGVRLPSVQDSCTALEQLYDSRQAAAAGLCMHGGHTISFLPHLNPDILVLPA